MTDEAIYQVMRKRRAIRRYEDRRIPDELLSRMFASALWAPSAHNRQPWRFAVLRTPTAKENLARAMGERLRQDRLHDGDKPELVERDVARSYARITGAPLVIVFFLSMVDMDHYPDSRRSHAERQMAVQSVAMAVQNLWLLAAAEGRIHQFVRSEFRRPPTEYWQEQWRVLTSGFARQGGL